MKLRRRFRLSVHSELRMIFLKALVNVPFRLLDRILPDPGPPHYPQTQLLSDVHKRMMRIYRLDCLQGTFGPVPDGNFERFLRVAWKVASRLGEDDRYYRAWIGLAFLLARSELDSWKPQSDEIVSWIRAQWLIDLSSLPGAFVEKRSSELVEIALCDYLGNLDKISQ